ncbi:MAG TPA: thioredoxin domain-containing protein, partial [Gaiellaceae bacterium]|nr:thioredoxin domain-containing protein [Gaiellaceae bacterium]
RYVARAEHGLALVSLDIDANLATPSRYGVLSVPTTILFAGGEARATVVGAQPRRRFERAFAEWLSG